MVRVVQVAVDDSRSITDSVVSCPSLDTRDNLGDTIFDLIAVASRQKGDGGNSGGKGTSYDIE